MKRESENDIVDDALPDSLNGVDKSTPPAAPPVAFDQLVRVAITSCENCPFYAHKYCGLSQRLNSQYGTDYPTFVVNEWRQGTTPTRCPLRTADMLFYLTDAQGDTDKKKAGEDCPSPTFSRTALNPLCEKCGHDRPRMLFLHAVVPYSKDRHQCSCRNCGWTWNIPPLPNDNNPATGRIPDDHV